MSNLPHAGLGAPPAVSVLLPVYNGAEELLTTMQFILLQTFTDFEVLAIDDGSTDNTWDVLQELATQDSRIRIFKNHENQGVARATVRLSQEARGHVLMKEDCGDYSAPTRYQRQYETLMANPDASACVSDYWLVDIDNTPMGIRKMPTTPEELKQSVMQSSAVCHSTFAMRKSAFDQTGGYDPDFECSLDYDMLLKLMAAGPVIPINEPLVAYKYNPGGITFRNLHKQAAYAELARARAFGGPPPEKFDYEPVSLKEAEATYHIMAGKLYLAKAQPHNARRHFKCATQKGSQNSGLLMWQTLSYIPAPVFRAVQKIRGKTIIEEQQKPFFL